MSLRNKLWISALAVGCAVVPASARDANNPPPTTPSTPTTPTTPTTPPTFTRTYVFPATGFAVSSETVRISAVNIAQTSHNGTKASCSVTFGFNDSTGKALGNPTAQNTIGTGQIATADYAVPPPANQLGGRSELQGFVQVSMTPSASAPCSLLLTLEVFDTATSATRSMITTAIEEPLEGGPIAFGHQ